MPMGYGWAWVGIGFVHLASNSKSESNLLDAGKYANQEALRAEANNNERPFICLVQPRLGVRGVIHNTQFLNTWAHLK